MFKPAWTRRHCVAIIAAALILNSGAAIATAGDLSPSSSRPGQETGASAPTSDAPTTEMPEVLVTDKKEAKPKPREGSAESGYRATSTTLGPLGKTKLLDTPFSISVTSTEFIENIQAANTTDALKYNPTLNPEMGSNRTADYLAIRGFINSSNQAVDGLRSNGMILEDKESIEVLSGASSFLYGIASPAGMVNYVLKRPVPVPMLGITLGDYGGEQAYAHIDAGGPMDREGKFGYRINLLGVGNGDTGIEHETHERYLLSGAFDWHITPDTLWSIDISRFHRELEHMQAFFLTGAVTEVPHAPDASINYAAPYNGSEDTYTTYGMKINSDINRIFSIRSSFRYSSSESNGFSSMRNKWIDNSGNYTQQMMYYKGQTETETIQGNIFLDASFNTGFIGHKVTLGNVTDYIENASTSPGTSTYVFPATTIFSLSNPGYSPDPHVPISHNPPYHTTQETIRQSTLLADQLTLGTNWSLLAGVSCVNIDDKQYSGTTGALTSHYDKTEFTPSVALMFKPVPQVTTYVSYIQAVEQGPVAPSTAANVGEILKPFVSDQVEMGVKALIGGMSLNAAVYRIEKVNVYTDPGTNIVSEDGREVHIGGELSFSGKVTDNFTLLGGFSILKATIEKTSNPALQDKSPQAVPETLARLYGEYALPAVPGLTVTAGISYTGEEWVNDANTLSIPYMLTGDMGLRYQMKVMGKDTTLRLNVNNITDENYWTSKGGGMLYLGSPRTIAMSATVNL
jgi:iron complex outermembrane receptor protein